MRCLIFPFLITNFSSIAHAEYEFYEGDYGKLSAGLQVQTAFFCEANNQAGGSAKSKLSDSFWELSVKPHFDGSLNLFSDSQLYGGFSYVYSSSLGHALKIMDDF